MKSFLVSARKVSDSNIVTAFMENPQYEFITYDSNRELFTWSAGADQPTTASGFVIGVITAENMVPFESESLVASGLDSGYVKLGNSAASRLLGDDGAASLGKSLAVRFATVENYISGLQKSLMDLFALFGMVLFLLMATASVVVACIVGIVNQVSAREISVKYVLGFGVWELYRREVLFVKCLDDGGDCHQRHPQMQRRPAGGRRPLVYLQPRHPHHVTDEDCVRCTGNRLKGAVMRPYIQIESLCKSFGQHRILSNLCLGIQKGDTVAVTGPSGCGKTTLLNILGLLDTPDSGEIYLAGTRYPKINSTAAMLMRRDEINYLFQSFALIDSRTVRDNLMLALRYTKLDTNEKLSRIRKTLERFSIGDKLSSTVSELSGGEKQRVAISRAMLKPGDLILADEPTGSLDARMAGIVMRSLVSATHDAGKTLVMVTHDMSMAAECDCILHMSNGVLHEMR